MKKSFVNWSPDNLNLCCTITMFFISSEYIKLQLSIWLRQQRVLNGIKIFVLRKTFTIAVGDTTQKGTTPRKLFILIIIRLLLLVMQLTRFHFAYETKRMWRIRARNVYHDKAWILETIYFFVLCFTFGLFKYFLII